MRRKPLNMPRKMWTEEEDKLLVQVVNGYYDLTWNKMAEKLQQVNPGIKKTGKQCRERYRNYLDVKVKKGKWTKDEKLLFVLLHNTYDNCWGEIAEFYPERNDLSMKNFFFSYFRKVLRKVRNKLSYATIASIPWKMLEVYYILELISLKYLPNMPNQCIKSNIITKDNTILDVVRMNELNKSTLIGLKAKLVKCFRDLHKTQSLPIVLLLDIESFHYDDLMIQTLNKIIKRKSFGELSLLLRIQIKEYTRTQFFNIPISHFNTPNHTLQQTLSYPSLRATSLITPSLQIVVPQFTIPIHCDTKNSTVSTSYFDGCDPMISGYPMIAPAYVNLIVHPIYFPYESEEFCESLIDEKMDRGTKCERHKVKNLAEKEASARSKETDLKVKGKK